MIDALRNDYISEENTPYLFKLKNGLGTSKVVPIFGFEPDASYMAGLYPDESETGAQFYFNPYTSPFKSLKYIPDFLNKIPEIPDKILRKTFTYLLKRNSKSPVFTLPYIPFNVAHNFDFTFNYPVDSDLYLKDHETIFKLLKKNGKSYFIHTIPDYSVNSNMVLKRIKNNLTERVDFAFLMIGDLDLVGHQYGPSSDEIKKAIKKVDEVVSIVDEILSRRFGKIDFFIFGDHGMCEVDQLYNIELDIKSTGLKQGKDYLYFIDSTMVRFWFFTSNAASIIEEKLSGKEYGNILTSEEISFYHLNYIDNKIGELIFICNPGVLLFPNFYQKHKPVKGMHGYLPNVPEQQSCFFINSEKIESSYKNEKPVDMRRVFPTVLKLLELPIYNTFGIEPLV